MSDMLPRPEPRDAFKRALRSQLMAQAATTLVRRETVWTRMQGGLLRPALALGAVALVLVGGAGKAAADSLPGDPAFALKTAAEELQLTLAFDDTSRLMVLSEAADHRLAELARALKARPETAPVATEHYAAAVARFTAAVDALRGKPDSSADKRTAAEDVVDAAHLKHEAVLEDLERSAPENMQQDVERARREADKLHASDRPARTPEPFDDPERSRSPQPTRTAAPTRSGEPIRTEPARPTETPERTRTAQPSATPSVRR